MSDAVKQFVILLHSLSDTRHWDLMLDTGESLATWQLSEDPSGFALGAIESMPARRIGDHRRAYLDYEGPVSGNRGHVTRADRGPYFLLVRQDRLWTVQFAGTVLAGTYMLSADRGGDDWTLQRLAR